jgi:hypothetical protein
MRRIAGHRPRLIAPITGLVLLLATWLMPAGATAAETGPEPAPFTVREGLFDQQQEDTLGLEFAPGAERFTIFRPGEHEDAYNHGAVLIPFGDHLYAQWQSSHRDEDSADTWVAYSRSRDGISWSPVRVLAAAEERRRKSAGGWWTDGRTLIAYISSWPSDPSAPRGGTTEFFVSEDGLDWTAGGPVLDRHGRPVNGIIEQDPHALPGGRIITAFHEQPGLVVAPWYTDDPNGVSGWTRGRMQNLPYSGDTSREIEPSWFYRGDSAVVMVFRDQAGSFRKLASVSHDRGESWTTPVLVDMPDSRSKQSAGNLPDGQAYLVGNPVTDRRRYPLVVALSPDGLHFDRAYLLRAGGSDLQAMRFEGRYKRAGFSYPKSVVWKDFLYVSYATNKEDIELTRVPLASLARP